MNGTHLYGLKGTNPLSFLAALGVQMVFENNDMQLHLWWSKDIVPHAIVDEQFQVDCIVTQALEVLKHWHDSFAINPKFKDDLSNENADTLKLQPKAIREYLDQASDCHSASNLASALLAQGSLDKQGVAKPTDFYFTAGNQKFLESARKILAGVSQIDLKQGLEGPWSYESNLPSLGWDVTDDRIYALRANNPSGETKLTNPGLEALALLGMSLHPVFSSTSHDRTNTQGCSGTWKSGYYSWPIWNKPSSLVAVKSLLAHAYHHPKALKRSHWYRSWGVSSILRSPIRRSKQGGYGTFGPPEIMWRVVPTE